MTGKLFSKTSQNITHVFRPKTQFGHVWREGRGGSVCIVFSRRYPPIKVFNYSSTLSKGIYTYNKFLFVVKLNRTTISAAYKTNKCF